mgnify:FL=1
MPMATARFGDALRVAQDNMDAQNFYGWNPAFDRNPQSRNENGQNRSCGCKR